MNRETLFEIVNGGNQPTSQIYTRTCRSFRMKNVATIVDIGNSIWLPISDGDDDFRFIYAISSWFSQLGVQYFNDANEYRNRGLYFNPPISTEYDLTLHCMIVLTYIFLFKQFSEPSASFDTC
jgi:hypothetical protein